MKEVSEGDTFKSVSFHNKFGRCLCCNRGDTDGSTKASGNCGQIRDPNNCFAHGKTCENCCELLFMLWWTCNMLTLAWRREASSGDFFQNMSESSRKCVRTLDSFLASTQSPSQADALQNDTEDRSTDGEQIKGREVVDESSERKTANFLYA